jgi:hypothetical protein
MSYAYLGFIISVILIVIGHDWDDIVIGVITGNAPLPDAGSPKIEEYNLLKYEIQHSSRFSPSGPGQWRYLDRPASLQFNDKTHSITIKGVNASNGKHFQHTLSINEIVELRARMQQQKTSPRRSGRGGVKPQAATPRTATPAPSPAPTVRPLH